MTGPIFRLDDRWTGDDKWAHGFGSLALVLLLGRLGVSRGWALGLTIAVGVGIELVQLWRWKRWQARGGTGPWPFMADLISPKDLAWDLAGAIAGWLALG